MGRDLPVGKPSEMDDGQRADAAAEDDPFHSSSKPNMTDPDAQVPGDGGSSVLEQCGNGMDEDGDGLADDGCACKSDQKQRCYAGPIANAGVGKCALGNQICDTSGEFAVWGECTEWVAPELEACNGEDDDCDALVDEGCECKVGFHRECFDGDDRKRDVGQCKAGSQSCDMGIWSDCEGQVLPSAEACDGLDNNCNGQVDESCDCDEGEQRECFSDDPELLDVGVCKAGTQTCSDGMLGECLDQVLPATEECDDLDNDCDAQIDEGCGCSDGEQRDCYEGNANLVGVGVCAAGKETCQDEVWGPCEDQVLPSGEVCDGLDNDCDGAVDGITRACYTGAPYTQDTGLCHGGEEQCVAGVWRECLGEVLPSTEVCDRLDSDCDQAVDEALNCTVVPPEPGTDIVVFNDINVFDATAMVNPDNVRLVQNLVEYTTAAERNDADEVWMDYTHLSQCNSTGECNATNMALMYSTMVAAGFTVTDVTTLYAVIPAEVKVIILWTPREAFTLDEVNMYKAFAEEGGRLVFIGEHDSYYTGLQVENAFLLNMGAVMTNIGGQVDCISAEIPTVSIRPHQITAGLTTFHIACSSVIVLGPTDYPLYYDTTNTQVLSGVATIDTTPLTQLIQP